MGLDPLAYPFDVPVTSYLWRAGRWSAVADDEVDLAGRAPVLAIGSNAAPDQLTRKFAGPGFDGAAGPDGVIPVLRATAAGIDVVHAAHVARYGSVPATPIASPGARARVCVTWLTGAQLARMHETEGLGRRHRVLRLGGVTSRGVGPEGAWCYASLGGAMTLDGRAVGLAAVDVAGTDLPRLTQAAVWDRIADATGLGPGGRELAAAVTASPAARRAVTAFLTGSSTADGLR